jgi:hypothetical protein|tara:strand:+ start:2286 stop:4028 length:1743 start_codon:yes stop_codon:yes gene_type:complete
MTAYIDTFRSVVLTPDNITLLADGVSDALTINADANKGLSLSASAEGSDTLDLNVDYSFSVPIGTSILRLQDVNANQKDITLSAGANITITRNSSSELVLSSTVGGNSKTVTDATAANPVVITTNTAHGFTEGTPVTLTDIVGMTQLNGNEYFMDILTSNTFALYTDAVLSASLDGTAFTAYTSGGVATAEYQTTNLVDMGDVLLTSPSIGKVLYHNGTKWVDQIIDTSVITENTNLFYTDTRVDNRFDTRLALKSTSDLAEGTNLYYTDTRANSAIDTRVTGAYISTLSGVIADSVDGDLTGSVFGDDSTILVDGVSNTLHGNLGTVTATESIKIHGFAPALENDYTQNNDVSVRDALVLSAFASGASSAGYEASPAMVASKSLEASWAPVTGTSYSHTKAGLRLIKGNTRDTLRNGLSLSPLGLGDTVILGNIDDDGGTAQVVSGLSIDGTSIYLQSNVGDDDTITIRQRSSGGYLNFISEDVGASQWTEIKMTPTNIRLEGAITATDTISGNLSGTVTGNLTGTMSGSVFGDDSSLLVDGINNRLVMANNTTDDLAEGSNNKYFTNGRAIAMTIVFG